MRRRIFLNLNRFSFEQLLNVSSNILCWELGAVAFHRDAFLIDKELFKVPDDISAHQGTPQNSEIGVHNVLCSLAANVITWKRKLAFEESENGVLATSIDVDLAKHLEIGLIAIAGSHVLECVQHLKLLLICLVAELVAGETKNCQRLSEFVSEVIHLSEIPHCRASQSRDILDEHHLAGIGTEVDDGPIDRRGACTAAKALCAKIEERCPS